MTQFYLQRRPLRTGKSAIADAERRRLMEHLKQFKAGEQVTVEHVGTGSFVSTDGRGNAEVKINHKTKTYNGSLIKKREAS